MLNKYLISFKLNSQYEKNRDVDQSEARLKKSNLLSKHFKIIKIFASKRLV